MAKDSQKKPDLPRYKFAMLGKKVGMTQFFNEEGELIPSTVLEVGPNVVLQKKTIESDGYNAVQLGFDDKKKQRVRKAEAGHAAKAKSPVKRFLKELRLDNDDAINNYEVGQTLSADMFLVGDHVDVTGMSKGKGFQGVMKRWGFAGFPATHGTHEMFRHGGSIGMRTTPGKVFKGKKMAGQMGNKQITAQNLEVVGIELDKNYVIIRGAVPGAVNGYITIKGATKKGFNVREFGKSTPEAAPQAEAAPEATT